MERQLTSRRLAGSVSREAARPWSRSLIIFRAEFLRSTIDSTQARSRMPLMSSSGRPAAVNAEAGRDAVDIVTAIYKASIQHRTIDPPISIYDP